MAKTDNQRWDDAALDKLANLPKEIQDEVDEHERQPVADAFEVSEEFDIVPKAPVYIDSADVPDFTTVKKSRRKKEALPEPPKPPVDPYEEDEEEPPPVLDKFIKSQLPTLKAIFTKEEIDKFISDYTQLVAQFKEDILFSEYLSVFNLVKFSIFMHRNHIENKQLIDQKNRLERMAHEQSQNMDETSRQMVLEMGKQAAELRMAIKIKSDELFKLNAQYSDMMTDLKITRSQRIKSLEGAQTSFVDVIKQIVIEDNAKSLSAKNTAFQKAMSKEKARLTQMHVFKDGTVVEPIMTSEIVAQNRNSYPNEYTEE